MENPDRKKNLLFTKPYLEIPTAIVTRKNIKKEINLSQMQGMKIAVIKNDVLETYLSEKFSFLNIYPKKDSTTCILELSTGNVDAAVLSIASAAYIIEKKGITNLRIAENIDFTSKIGFGVRKDWPILKDILETGIDSISVSEKNSIYKKWIHLDIIPFYKKTSFWIITSAVFCLVSSIIALIMFWNHNLKKAVIKRTLDIQKKEAHLKTLVETIPELVWVKDPDGKFLSCNLKFQRLFGADESEIIGKTDYDFVKKEKADLFRSHDNEAFNANGPVIREEEIVFADDGHRELLEMITTPMFGPDGKIIGVLGIGHDITKRKEMEIELRNKQNQLESILSNIQGMTFRCMLDKDWTMTYLSSHVKKLTGYKAEVFINNSLKTYKSIILEEDRDMVEKSVYKAVEKKEPWDIDYRIRHKNNNIYWVHEKGAAVFDDEGNIEYLDGFVININDKKIMENHFNQAQKMEAIGSLAGGIAHDFNNILSGILGFAELLQEDLKETEIEKNITRKVDYILKGCSRASELVAQILAFSRPESDESKPVRVKFIAKEIINFLRASMPATIKIEHKFDSDAKVMGEPAKIHQVLMNLCTNAGYAMKDKGGILSIGIDEIEFVPKDLPHSRDTLPGKYIQISVKDTGCGMDEEVQKKMMDPFFTTKPKGIGTGMGLWMVNGIISEMGGFIKVESEPEKGSLFKINIPVLKEKLILEKKEIETELQRGKGRLLFIDDEESLIQLAKTTLTELGYEVTALNSGKTAIEYFEKNPDKFDLVITDMTMPEITGYEICRRIKNRKENTPVILYTGALDDETRDKNFQIFDSILQKPVLMSKMAAKIKRLLDGKNKD